jgi:RNA polymerase sigma-70 factor (ECF subfamily)
MTRADDADLSAWLEGVAAGDRQDFRALYDATAPVLFGACLRLLRDRAAAEDALQDAYVRVWSRSHRYDPDKGRAMAWLLTIARNVAIDRLRRAAAQPLTLDIDETDLTYLAEPLGERAPSDGRDVRRCLSELDQQSQRVILLAFAYGLTHAELAKLLDRPLGTVKSWIRRGLAAMRRCLEKDE